MTNRVGCRAHSGGITFGLRRVKWMGCLSPVVGVPKTEAPCDLDMIHILREDSRGTEWPAACRPIMNGEKPERLKFQQT